MAPITWNIDHVTAKDWICEAFDGGNFEALKDESFTWKAEKLNCS